MLEFLDLALLKVVVRVVLVGDLLDVPLLVGDLGLGVVDPLELGDVAGNSQL